MEQQNKVCTPADQNKNQEEMMDKMEAKLSKNQEVMKANQAKTDANLKEMSVRRTSERRRESQNSIQPQNADGIAET
jgi:hypothetical protein